MFKGHSFFTETAIHCICWLLLVALEMSMVAHILGRIPHPLQYIIYYGINIGAFYSQIYFMNLKRRIDFPQILAVFIRFFIIICVFFLVKSSFTYLFSDGPGVRQRLSEVKKFIPENLFRTIFFSILALFYVAAGYISHLKLAKLESEKKYLQSEHDRVDIQVKLERAQNAYHRQQINPHLLFNTLNFIYDHTYKISGEAGEAVLKLSDIMRYSLEPADPDNRVALNKEIAQVQNLIALNESHFPEKSFIDFSFDNPQELRVLPLVLATITENVVKHGLLTDPQHPAIINLSIKNENRIDFKTWNLKKRLHATPGKISQGLDNVGTRLAHAYGNNYNMDILDDKDSYEIHLNFPG